MNILISICARGGSKGIPGKNIKLLNGKPLIAYTIDVAKRFSAFYSADIALSTDDVEDESNPLRYLSADNICNKIALASRSGRHVCCFKSLSKSDPLQSSKTVANESESISITCDNRTTFLCFNSFCISNSRIACLT